MPVDLDEVDRTIICELYDNARRKSTQEMAELADVTPTTISNRIKKMEEEGIIAGYRPQIDFEKAGYPLEVMLTCTAAISEREDSIDQAFELGNVIEVRELMVGADNVHIRAVGKCNADITEVAKAVDEIGFEVKNEILVKGDRVKPPASLKPARKR